VFNASLRIHFVVALAVIIIGEILGPVFVKQILDIPVERIEAAVWVYDCVIFIVFFEVLSVPFQAMTNANEDMHVIAIRDIFSSFGKLLIALILGWVYIDRLKLYGGLMLLLTFITTFSFYWFCHRNYNECQIPKKRYDNSV